MNTVDPNSRELVQYLLGELSESEQTAFEERFFEDDDLYEILRVTEDELIDQYVTDHLPPAQRTLFEQRFLTHPHRRERIELARALHDKARSHRTRSLANPQTGSWWQRWRGWFTFSGFPFTQLAFATAMVVLLVVSTLVVIDNRRMRRELDHMQSEQAAIQQQTTTLNRQIAERTSQTERLTQELAQSRSLNAQLEQKLNTIKPAVVQRVTEAVISFVLKAGTLRGEGPEQQIVIKNPKATVVLKLTLPSQMKATSFSARLATTEGKTTNSYVWSTTNLEAQTSGSGKYVTCVLSAQVLTPDTYILTLTSSSVDVDGEETDFQFSVSE
ncbi:MAG TPA: hypothetical protein PLB18_23800 [Acidobacteriota bacterium]|nr:hypothetical protein [Acidobacteriota bacterium]